MAINRPKILDVTVRDGSFLINHQYTPEQVGKIAKGLSMAGIQFAEISHGCGIGGRAMGFPGIADDDELLEAAHQAAPKLKFSIFISPVDLSLPVIPALIPYFEIGRVGVNVTDLAKGERVIQKLKKYEKKVSVQLVRSPARPPEYIGEAAKKAEEMGADIVYVVDTFGSMTPKETQNYIKAAKAATKIEIGFHGHNNLGLAVSNTIAAWQAGATWLDGSLGAVGKGAGNASLEALAYFFNEHSDLSMNTSALSKITDELIIPLFQQAPTSSLHDILFGQERMDYFSPELLGLLAPFLQLSTEEFITSLHAKMGNDIELTEEHIKAIFHDKDIDYDTVLGTLGGKDAKK